MTKVGAGLEANSAVAEERSLEENSPKSECITFAELKDGALSQGHCVMVDGVCVPAKTLLQMVEENAATETAASGNDEAAALQRALLAECIGTCMIVLFGCGCVCATLAGPYSGIWQVAAVWGLGVSLAIYSTAEASGAHLNPAITLAFQLIRPSAHKMTWKKSGLYVVAQMVGGILGGFINPRCFFRDYCCFRARERNHSW